MSRLLLDTSAYAAFFRDHPGVKAEVQEASEIHLSPIVLGELRSEFLKGSRREGNEKELREFLASPRCSVPAIDDETSHRSQPSTTTCGGRGHPCPPTISGSPPRRRSTASRS